MLYIGYIEIGAIKMKYTHNNQRYELKSLIEGLHILMSLAPSLIRNAVTFELFAFHFITFPLFFIMFNFRFCERKLEM